MTRKRLFAWSVGLAAVFLLMRVVHWEFFDIPPKFVEQFDAWIETDIGGPIYAGDVIYVQRHFHIHCEGVPDSADRQITDDVSYQLTDKSVETRSGEYNARRRFHLPLAMHPGTHHYEMASRCRINPLVTVPVVWETIDFVVEPGARPQ